MYIYERVYLKRTFTYCTLSMQLYMYELYMYKPHRYPTSPSFSLNQKDNLLNDRISLFCKESCFQFIAFTVNRAFMVSGHFYNHLE